MKDHRSQIKTSNPTYKVSEISKALGKLWGNTSETEKEKYKKLALKEKSKYELKLKEYIEEHGEPVKKVKKGKNCKRSAGKKEVEEGKPKKPLTPFFLYQSDRRKAIKEENPDMQHKDIVKKMGEEWQEMEEGEKKKYLDRNKKLKEEYKVEVEKWEKEKEGKEEKEEKEKSADESETREEESDESDE